MKQKMIVFVSLGNTVVLSHLQSCTRFRKEGRRATGALQGAEWLSVKRHLLATFWLAEEEIVEDMNCGGLWKRQMEDD